MTDAYTVGKALWWTEKTRFIPLGRVLDKDENVYELTSRAARVLRRDNDDRMHRDVTLGDLIDLLDDRARLFGSAASCALPVAPVRISYISRLQNPASQSFSLFGRSNSQLPEPRACESMHNGFLHFTKIGKGAALVAGGGGIYEGLDPVQTVFSLERDKPFRSPLRRGRAAFVVPPNVNYAVEGGFDCMRLTRPCVGTGIADPLGGEPLVGSAMQACAMTGEEGDRTINYHVAFDRIPPAIKNGGAVDMKLFETPVDACAFVVANRNLKIRGIAAEYVGSKTLQRVEQELSANHAALLLPRSVFTMNAAGTTSASAMFVNFVRPGAGVAMF